MKTATFENSVNVLVKAYFDGTLEHGNCHACAVGNLVTQACGFTYKKAYGVGVGLMGCNILWSHRDSYYEPDDSKLSWYAVVKVGKKSLEGLRQVEAVGYSIDELKRIEEAFESVDWLSNDRMFDGLMAVVDVLADIHGISLEAKEEAKAMFVKETL